MGEHRKSDGLAVIRTVEGLGHALGYHVVLEWPIPGTGPHPQEIDVCWFTSATDTAPLFAFEIESRDVPAATNNPQKVFAKTANQLLKPLFFFHIFLDSVEASTRIGDLRSQYGHVNYCTYEASRGETSKLLLDVLRQHRRLSNHVAMTRVMQLVASWAVPDASDAAVARWISELGFGVSSGTLLPDLMAAGYVSPDVIPVVIDEIARVIETESIYSQQFETYLSQYQEPLLLALLAAHRTSRADVTLERLKKWQTESRWIRPRIGPHFHLNIDYDNFVVCISPSYWAIILSLVGDHAEMAQFACDQVRLVQGAVAPAFKPFASAWLLHMAAPWPSCQEHFESSRQLLNDLGVPLTAVLDPPSVLPLKNEFPSEPIWPESREPFGSIPNRDDFLLASSDRPSATLADITVHTMRLLVDHSAILEYGPTTIARLRAFKA